MSSKLNFEVLFHEGEEAGLATKGRRGRLSLGRDATSVIGKVPCVVPFEFLRGVELLRLPKMGSVMKVTHAHGTLIIAVVRSSLFGLRTCSDGDATRRLAQELRQRIVGDLPEPGASFLGSLASVPWFENLGRRDEASDVEWLAGWESWPGPEDWSVASLSEENQTLHEEILASAGDRRLELMRLFDMVSDAVVNKARLRLPDSSGDPWNGPSFAILQAADTAGLVALCLQSSRPVPVRLERQWKWFQRGHWPSGYAWVPDGAEVERLVIY